MAPPSALPAAWRVAEMCFEKYQVAIDPHCDPALRVDLEALAEYFAGRAALQTIFLRSLVPWEEFTRPSNSGHGAIADFLLTRSIVACLSSNYDNLIERRAWDYGADLQVALDGDQASVQAAVHAPLLKFHGCAFKDRDNTVWTRSQLGGEPIAGRIERSATWMAANLRNRDLLVTGFWTDWGYLNRILTEALGNVTPSSIIVVDPSPQVELAQKAPELWAIAHRPGVAFDHIQESGADALDELRRAFSARYLRQVFAAGRQAFEAELGVPCADALLEVVEFDSESLYNLRRDAEGAPGVKPAISKRPGECELLGLFHLLLRAAGAQQNEEGYELKGRRIRVINGAGKTLSTMQSRYVAPPATISADMVVAVGATETGLPGHLVRPGHPFSIVRPAAGGDWFDLLSARQELNI